VLVKALLVARGSREAVLVEELLVERQCYAVKAVLVVHQCTVC
jgi:hypothetical protein